MDENKEATEPVANELENKYEALMAEFEATKERIAKLEEQNKALAIENQRLVLRSPAHQPTDAELFSQFFK